MVTQAERCHLLEGLGQPTVSLYFSFLCVKKQDFVSARDR